MKLERASYELIRKKYAAMGKKGVRLTQSTLQLMMPINATTKSYTFPVLTTDQIPGVPGGSLPEEIRLNINDEFVSYDVAYMLQAKATVGPLPNNDRGNFYFTYVPQELNADMGSLNNAWDGVLSIAVNNIKRLEKWDMLKHKCIPRTQFQNTSAGIPQATQASLCYGSAGTSGMQPMTTLSGAKKNEIIIAVTGAIPVGQIANWVTLGGTVTYTFANIVLIFRGMLAQNASKFQ
jgi:hypothetical protein